MSTLKLNGKNLASQTSSAEPVIASTVTGGAGLSGMTSLGTVTAGTLASSVVFPAGHVIQVVSDMTAFDGTGYLTADGETYTDDTHANGVLISNVTAGNKLIAMVSSGYAYYHSTSGTNCYFRIGFSPDTGSDTFNDAEGYYTRTQSDFTFQVVPSIQSLYTIPSGVTSVAVIRRVVSGSAAGYITWGSVNNKYVHCIIMEVQG